MSGATGFRKCCCEPQTGLYYALRCDNYFDNYCCEVNCNGPARIDLCPDYLAAIGVPVPPVPGVCYLIAYNCCAYWLAGFENVPCCPVPQVRPCNVGYLISVFPSNNEPCCPAVPPFIPKQPPGEIGEIFCEECGEEGAYVIENNENPCHEFIADCYDLCDQYGLVPGKEITVCSNLSVCVKVFGIPPELPCDAGSPDTFYKISKKVTQKIGTCITKCPVYNGIPLDPCPPQPTYCPEQRVKYFFAYQDCVDGPDRCAWTARCCGGPDPCATDPDACDLTLDETKTYDVTTCYGVFDCEDDYHEAEVMKLRVWDCIPIGAGIDPNNAEQLENWVREVFITKDKVMTGTCWGEIETHRFNICGLTIDIVSGDAERLADKINYRLNGLVRATADPTWKNHFWFGTRQPCLGCEGPATCVRPDFLSGDTTVVGDIVYLPAQNTVEISILGKSRRKSLCVSQEMQSEFNCFGVAADTGTVTAAVSAKGDYPFERHCLSLPEFSRGDRYEMMAVEQDGATQEICTASGTMTVPLCAEKQGYPLEDIVLNGEIVTMGYLNLCEGMKRPRSNCRCYPFVYELLPCNCDPCTRLPCVDYFQDPEVYCETTALEIPTVVFCGTEGC